LADKKGAVGMETVIMITVLLIFVFVFVIGFVVLSTLKNEKIQSPVVSNTIEDIGILHSKYYIVRNYNLFQTVNTQMNAGQSGVVRLEDAYTSLLCNRGSQQLTISEQNILNTIGLPSTICTGDTINSQHYRVPFYYE